MADVVETKLCVGGPLAGQHATTHPHETDRFAVAMDCNITEPKFYFHETIRGEQNYYSLWRWQDLTKDQALEALLEGYRP